MSRNSELSVIEFRRSDRALTTGGKTFQIVIDGKSLEERYNRAKGKWNTSVPLSTWPSDGIDGLDLWSGSVDPTLYEGDLREEPDRIAVLTCGCGELMCGGVVCPIEFENDVVTWSDFRHANYLTPKSIGPFVFHRAQYDRALAVARSE